MTEQKLNEWWGNTDFKQMKNITRLRCHWFDVDEGYQEFVDICDNWWKNLSTVEKQSIYEEYQ
jgi:hypothetical protein